MDDLAHRIAGEIPRLRRYARALFRSNTEADDLVQMCLLRALTKQHLWQEGTNLRAWLFTILHNQFVNEVRRTAREANLEFDDDRPALPRQERWHLMATILTVDDSPSIRQMIKVVLEPAGHNVIEAGDGAQGLAKAQAGKLDLVITDLNMPVMNGLELIRALRKLPSAVGMPIVFLTTESNDAVKQEAKSAGATGWITKPFKPEQLLTVVAKLVRS